MKFLVIIVLAFLVSACSDGFDETDRENLVKLKHEVRQLREIINEKNGVEPSDAQTSEFPFGAQPPKDLLPKGEFPKGIRVYNSGVDEALNSIGLLKTADVVRFFTVTNPDDQSKQIKVELVAKDNAPYYSFIATNYDELIEPLLRNDGFISLELSELRTDKYNNPDDISLKKAIVAIFKDNEHHTDKSLARIKKMNEQIDFTMYEAKRALESSEKLLDSKSD